MKTTRTGWLMTTLAAATITSAPALANDYRERGHSAEVAGASLTVTPNRDWNRLRAKPGKHAETWTLDGEQLNDVTFYGAIEPGESLVRSANSKREPLPKFTDTTLLTEVPELLEATYRTARKIGAFTVTGSRLDQFVGKPGVSFTYDYIDADNLPRKGQAQAAIVDHKLYMATFDAPRVYYFDRSINDFKALAETAKLLK